MVSLSNHAYKSTSYSTLRQAQGDNNDFLRVRQICLLTENRNEIL